MTGKKPDKLTQRQKFEAAAEAYEKANGNLSDADLNKVIGTAGKKRPQTEAEARRKAGMPKASH